MKLEIFTLCDAATDTHGKLNILGSFDTLWARDEPVAHPACAVAIKMRFLRAEDGKHQLRLTFADADGRLILPPMDAGVTVRVAEEDRTATANLVLNLQQVRLPRFGEYTIDLALDGQAEGSLPLYVKRIPDSSHGGERR